MKYSIPLYCFTMMVHQCACIMFFSDNDQVMKPVSIAVMVITLAAMVAIGQSMCPKSFFSRKTRGFMLVHSVMLWFTMVLGANHNNQTMELIGIFGMFASVFFLYRSFYHALKQMGVLDNDKK